ncbi:MAG: hypothetical protein WC614_06390 [bacterium]
MRWIIISILINTIVFGLQAKAINQNQKIPNKLLDKTTTLTLINKSVQTIPQEINYQGYLEKKSDTLGLDIMGNFSMTFTLYNDSTTGSVLWNETQTSVPVIKGIFNVLLGSINPIPTSIFTGTPLWLETQIDSQILSPRKKLVSTPYAMRAEHSTYADTVKYAFIRSTYVLMDSTSPYFWRIDRPDTNNWHQYIAPNPDSIPQGINSALRIKLDPVNNRTSGWEGLGVVVSYNGFDTLPDGTPVQDYQAGSVWGELWGHTAPCQAFEGGMISYTSDSIYGGPVKGLRGWVDLRNGKVGDLTTVGVLGQSYNKGNGSQYGGLFQIGTGNNSGRGSKYAIKGEATGLSSGTMSAGIFTMSYDTSVENQNGYGVNIRASGMGKTNIYGVKATSSCTVSTGGVAYGGHFISDSIALFCSTSTRSKNYAGYFAGNVKVNGNLIANNNLILSNDELLLSNENNNDIILSDKTYFRISGPTQTFSINGFAPITANKVIIIYNSTNQNMIIKNNSGINPVNGIYTLRGTDITTNGSGSVTLVYDGTEQRWIVTNWQE